MGYSIIGLENIQNGVNLRISIRNASALGANSLFYTSQNVDFSKRQDDTMQYKNMPVFKVKNLKKVIPFNAEIIVVELTKNAENLNTFKHPENAFYIFGNELKGVSNKYKNKKYKKIFIDSKISLNLSSTVSIVLYDRNKKNNLL